MDHKDFCYWLQGYFELTPKGGLTSEQVEVIKDHLKLTMVKVTPGRTIYPPKIQGDSKKLSEVFNPPVNPEYIQTCGTVSYQNPVSC